MNERISTSPLHLVCRLALLLLFLQAAGLAQIEVVGELAHRFELLPGNQVTGEVQIRNSSDSVASATLYLEDVIYDGRQLQYLPPGEFERSSAGWTTINPPSVDLAPGETQEVTFRISVPSDTSLDGTYWTSLIIENAATEEQAVEDQQFGIRAITRYQVMLAVQLPTADPVPLTFNDPGLHRGEEEQTYLFTVAIGNPGDALYRVATYVEVYDPNGTPITTVEGQERSIYPGAMVDQVFELGELEDGIYSVLVVADGGALGAYGARYNLEVSANQE